MNWTASATPDPPPGLRYDVIDESGTIIASDLQSLSATVVVPVNTTTPTVRVRSGAMTSISARAATTPCWGPPVAPTMVSTQVNATDILVSWTPPAGSPAGTYTVTATPTGPTPTGPAPTRTCTTPTTTCTLTNLTSGTTYTIAVTATNTAGTSDASPATVATPPGAPHNANLALWLDAAAPATLATDTTGSTNASPGQEIARWEDRSGNNRHATRGATAVTGATLTAGGLNGRTALRFTRTAPEFYDVTGAGIGAVGSNDRTMIVVGTARTIDGTRVEEDFSAFAVWPGPHSGITVSGPLAPDADVNSIGAIVWDANFGNMLRTRPVIANTPHVLTARGFTQGGRVTSGFSMDGQGEITGTSPLSGTWKTYSDLLRIGAGNDPAHLYQGRLDGDIAEILLYDRALTPTEQRAAESYLAAKWGLTLAPDAPTAVTGTGGVNQIDVTWTPPTDTGGAPVTTYTASAAPTGQTCTAVAPATDCTITGLTNGTSYTVTVTANNTTGTGPATPPTSVSTLAAAPPTGVAALTEGTRMSVSWTVPSDTGGSPITDYTIQYRVLGDTTWTTATDGVTTNTTTFITGLTPATTYQVRVAAITAVGTGTYTTPVTSTPGQAWTPANLTGGTAIWYDANDATTLTTTGGLIDQWRDKSGNNRHANQTGTARPTLTAGLINGRPAAAFDGTNDNLPIDGTILAGTDYTITAAAARTSNKADNYYLGGTTSSPNNANLHLGWRLSTTLTHAQYLNDYNMTVPGYSTPTPTVLINSHDNATGKATHADGALIGSSSDQTALISWNGATIGRFYTGLEYKFFDGSIGEIVITTTALTTPDRQRLEGYLASKWGTPLPAGHPFAGNAPLNP